MTLTYFSARSDFALRPTNQKVFIKCINGNFNVQDDCHFYIGLIVAYNQTLKNHQNRMSFYLETWHE